MKNQFYMIQILSNSNRECHIRWEIVSSIDMDTHGHFNGHPNRHPSFSAPEWKTTSSFWKCWIRKKKDTTEKMVSERKIFRGNLKILYLRSLENSFSSTPPKTHFQEWISQRRNLSIRQNYYRIQSLQKMEFSNHLER